MNLTFRLVLVGIQIAATGAALVVAWRAICVISNMDIRRRAHCYPRFAGFGCGYILLALEALGSIPLYWQPQIDIGAVMWVTASALLILCDPRRRARWEDRHRATGRPG